MIVGDFLAMDMALRLMRVRNVIAAATGAIAGTGAGAGDGRPK